MLFVPCVCYAFLCVCLYVPCGQLLGKGWPLGSRLWCLTVSLSLSHWYPGSGVVLDCIDSWSLLPYLLCQSHCHSGRLSISSNRSCLSILMSSQSITGDTCLWTFYSLLIILCRLRYHQCLTFWIQIRPNKKKMIKIMTNSKIRFHVPWI